MEVIVICDGRENNFDSESFGIIQTDVEEQILSKMNAALQELHSDIPWAVKQVVETKTTVGNEGISEESVPKIYVFPSPTAGMYKRTFNKIIKSQE